MHERLGNRVGTRLGTHLVLAFATFGMIAVIAPGGARAQVSDHAQCGTTLPACTTLRTNCCTRDFEGSAAQKAILIPMDRCHQKIANGGANGPTTSASSPTWCVDDPSGFNSNAMNRAYGLVYRLMQNKIPVYWIVNPTKGASLEGLNASNISGTPDPKTKDVDFWVVSAAGTPPAPANALTALGGATAPIKRVTLTNPGTASATFTSAVTYSRQEFPVRGGAFLIAPDDRAAFDAFHKTQLGRTCGTSGQDCYDFRDVWYYEVDPSAKFVWQDYTQPLTSSRYYQFTEQLPVAMRIDYAAPKISLVDGNLLRNFLAAANLNDFDTGACRNGTLASNVVGCVMSEGDIQSDYLASGDFNWLWLDVNNSSNCSATMSKLRTFMTAVTLAEGTPYTAGNVMFMNSAIAQFAEQCTGTKGTLGLAGTGLAMLGSSLNEATNAPMINRYPANLFSQSGDLQLNFSQGNVTGWTRTAGTTNLYSATYDTAPVTLRRLMTQENSLDTAKCTNRKDVGLVNATSSASCDNASVTANADVTELYAYGRYLNNKNNGLVFYSPGNNLTPSGNQAQLRMVLSSLVATPPFTVEQVFTNTEVTRASPIVATIDGKEAIIQGSYEYHYKTDGTKQYQVPNRIPGVYVRDDIAGFTFPVFKGHLRATEISSTTDTTARNLDFGTVIFDAGAAGKIPPVSFTGCTTNFNGSCRTVWTTLAGGLKPDTFFVDEDEHATVGAAMLPESAFTEADRRLFIQRILKGYDDGTGYVSALGGIDRSTVAVIGPGASVGGARPTIAYVGATDGMLHAICASVGGGCQSLGQELWAYVPRVNLSTLRYNTARIDGSARVLDVRADFYGTGATLKTVLIFQTGGGDPGTPGQTPAVYALDVTNPSAPRVLWEYTTPATRSAVELGNGLTVSAGDAIVGAARKNLVIAQTTNGGTGAAASVVTAIETDTGLPVWTASFGYDPVRNPASPAVPESGIPPGAVTIDKTVAGSNGFFTDIVVGDLYGRLWVLSPEDGTSRYENSSGVKVPLFQFTTDFHPITKPAIYLRNGEQFAVFTSGGYADYSTTKGWGTYTTTQYLIAVGLNTPSGTTTPPLPLTEASPSGFVPVNEVIVGRGYAQARIVGDEIFVTTDTSDVNAATFGTSASATGTLYAYDFAATSSPLRTTVVATGAGSVANSNERLFSSSGSKRQEAGFAAKSTVGASVTAAEEVTQMIRKLWLRTE